MSIITFDNALKKTKFLFRLSGADLERPENNSKAKLKNNTIFFLNMFILSFDVYGEIREVFVGSRPFAQASFALTCVAFSTICVSKLVFVMKNHEGVVYILRKLCKEHPFIDKEKITNKTLEGKLHKDMFMAMNIYNSIVNLVYFTNLMLLIVVMATPILVIIYFYIVKKEIKVLYPLVASYNYIDLSDPKFWPILYPHQCWSGLFTLAGIIGSDFLFYTFCTCILLQFKMLGYRIRTVVKNSTTADHEIQQQTLYYNFAKIIERHQEIIRLVKIIDGIYSKALLVQYSLSSLIICLCAFNIAITHDMAFLVSFIFALISSQWQVFILCYFGDSIVNSSSEFAQDIYSCVWTSCDVKIRRTVIIMIIRAQKECKITAYKFSDVNLKTFTTILSTSWSYFALLKTMYSPN